MDLTTIDTLELVEMSMDLADSIKNMDRHKLAVDNELARRVVEKKNAAEKVKADKAAEEKAPPKFDYSPNGSKIGLEAIPQRVDEPQGPDQGEPG